MAQIMLENTSRVKMSPGRTTGGDHNCLARPALVVAAAVVAATVQQCGFYCYYLCDDELDHQKWQRRREGGAGMAIYFRTPLSIARMKIMNCL